MTGLNETTFAPGMFLSRAQFSVILYRMNGSPKIEYDEKSPDVLENEWYTEAVLWAKEQKIINGYENGNFGPNDNITREQMAVMMFRYAKMQRYDTTQNADISGYEDVENISDYAYNAMQWANENGIITGKSDGKLLAPQDGTSRAEAATIVMRFLQKYEG